MRAVLLKLLTWAGTLVVVLAIIAVGELLPPIQWLDAYLNARPAFLRILSGTAFGLAILGTLLLVGTQFIVRVGDEQVTRLGGAAAGKRTSGKQGWFLRRFSGIPISSGFSDEAPFWEVKRAFQTGAWRREPRWQRMSLMLLGAVCLLYGLFGFFFLVSSPGVKLLMSGGLAYATVRTLHGFAVARPGGE